MFPLFFIFFILRNGFQKLNKIKVRNRQYKQLEELRRKTRDANGWVGCFLCQNLRIDLHFFGSFVSFNKDDIVFILHLWYGSPLLLYRSVFLSFYFPCVSSSLSLLLLLRFSVPSFWPLELKHRDRCTHWRNCSLSSD